jgi:methyl-accepting chemotaxis protein
MSFVSRLNIGVKLIVVVLTLMVATVGANYAFFMSHYRKDAQEALSEKAAAFTAVADQAKAHTSRLHADKDFDLKPLLDELTTTVKSGGDYRTTRMFKTIPVVAGWTAAAEAAKLEHIDFSVTAFQARNKDHTPAAGSFKEQLLKDLEAQVKAGGGDTLGRIDEKTNQYVYLRAIRLDESCMLCHGDPARYDAKDEHGAFDGKDPLGFAMESWKPGDMHGAFEVSMPLSTVDAQVAGFFQNGLIITIPLLIVAAGVFIFIIRHLLTKPVAAMVQTMNQIISTHDLTRRLDIKRGDEVGQIGHWFDELVGSLHKIISDVLSSTRQVAAASTQIAASSEEMAAGLTRQEQQAAQVSAAVEEMSASISEVAQKSQDAARNAGASQSEAGTGGKVVAQTVEEMHSIADDVHKSSQAIAELGKKGEQIGAIIEVINDIADQTNLLALNAAIEAARAGEHGRGFAVVADEVRKLAERTTQATEEVARSIRDIQTETQAAVQRIDAGSKRVKTGVELASSAGEALNRIVSSSQGLAGMVQSIAAASEEQSSASEQISRSVEQITAVTKESAEGASQAARAAADLSAQAERLQELVAKFKV